MKILKAKNYITNLTIQEFKVKDLMLLPDEKWINKRMPAMRESIEKNGMLWPIIVTDHIHYWHDQRPNWPRNLDGSYKQGLASQSGNKRVKYALENDYDLIEGYFVKNKAEQTEIIIKTHLSKDNWPI